MYTSPSVVLDQCVSSNPLADMFAGNGFYVARAMCDAHIDDDEIHRRANEMDALIITKDGDFTRSRRAMVLTPRMRLDPGGRDLILHDAFYVFGMEDHPLVDRQGAYADRLKRLRERFSAYGHPADASRLESDGISSHYSHNDPNYIPPINRHIRRLQAAGADEKSRIGRRLSELDKQRRELERHVHNFGYKRGVGFPVPA